MKKKELLLVKTGISFKRSINIVILSGATTIVIILLRLTKKIERLVEGAYAARTRPLTIRFLKGGLLNSAVDKTSRV